MQLKAKKKQINENLPKSIEHRPYVYLCHWNICMYLLWEQRNQTAIIELVGHFCACVRLRIEYV